MPPTKPPPSDTTRRPWFRLLAMMRRSGVDQTALAKRVGVTKESVQKWRKGGGISFETRRKLADALGVERDLVMGLDDETHPYDGLAEQLAAAEAGRAAEVDEPTLEEQVGALAGKMVAHRHELAPLFLSVIAAVAATARMAGKGTRLDLAHEVRQEFERQLGASPRANLAAAPADAPRLPRKRKG